MKRIVDLVVCIALSTLVGCSSTHQAQGWAGASNEVVLLVAAENMNANSSSNELNELMRTEVATFSKSLKKNLEGMGREVTLKEFKSASESDIASSIARMSKRPGVLVQIYWSAKQQNSMYITADALRIQYSDSAGSVRFASLDKKDYLSIGLSAKPTDTPEAHASSYSQHLKSALP